MMPGYKVGDLVGSEKVKLITGFKTQEQNKRE